MTKRIKQCDHCWRRFKNRVNLRNHLVFFHDAVPYRGSDLSSASREGKPHRRVRMMMRAARVKRERDNVSSAKISMRRTA